MKNSAEIGAFIADRRREMGLTQEALIEKIGDDKLSISTLRRIESGQGSMNVIRLATICQALGCKLQEAIIEDEKREALRKAYNEPGEEEEIDARLVELQLCYPEEPEYFVYQNMPINSLMKLLIYLPLLDLENLMQWIYNNYGDFFGNEHYVLNYLKRQYERIPAGDAKDHADLMAARCTAEYFMSYHTSEETEIDRLLIDQNQWPDLFRKSDCYRKETICMKRSLEAARMLKDFNDTLYDISRIEASFKSYERETTTESVENR